MGAVVLAGSLALTGVAAAAVGGGIDRAATARQSAARIAAPTPPPAATEDALGLELVDRLNAERARRGLPALEWQPQVAAAALAHSTDMAAHRRMSHTGTDGSNAGDRLVRAGFTWGAWAENIGAGYATPAAMFDGWMNSSGHRANMLGQHRYVGVAAVDGGGALYWTLVVAS